MRSSAIIVVLAGCFSKPDAPAVPIDAPAGDAPACGTPSPPGLAVSSNASPTITWPEGMVLQLANPAVGVAMPTFLSLTAENVLASSPGVCGIEDQVGVAMYPVFSATASDPRSAYESSELDRDIVGPAYTRFTVRWARDFQCAPPTPPTRATGTTVFSLFPDNRIVRVDTVTPADRVTPSAAACSCTGSQTGFIVTSFFAVQREQFSRIAYPMIQEGAAFPAINSDVTGERAACVVEDAGSGRLAIAWDVPSQPPAAPTRIRTVVTPSSALVFVLDLFRAPTLSLAPLVAHTTIKMLGASNPDDCNALLTAAAVSWPPISIGPVGGQALDLIDSTEHRVHVDSTSHSGAILLRATNGDVPGGMVVSVKLPGTSITTSRPGGVVWQREADGRFFVWFRDPLPAGEEITITPCES